MSFTPRFDDESSDVIRPSARLVKACLRGAAAVLRKHREASASARGDHGASPSRRRHAA